MRWINYYSFDIYNLNEYTESMLFLPVGWLFCLLFTFRKFSNQHPHSKVLVYIVSTVSINTYLLSLLIEAKTFFGTTIPITQG